MPKASQIVRNNGRHTSFIIVKQKSGLIVNQSNDRFFHGVICFFLAFTNHVQKRSITEIIRLWHHDTIFHRYQFRDIFLRHFHCSQILLRCNLLTDIIGYHLYKLVDIQRHQNYTVICTEILSDLLSHLIRPIYIQVYVINRNDKETLFFLVVIL